jgi:putative NIF3 family GTP cyclohydrolase 1 type 2
VAVAGAAGGLTTDELMRIALDLAGLAAVPPDSGIHAPGRGIRRALFALDVNVGLLMLAKQLGYDAVIGHHPCGTLLRQGEVYREHYRLVTLFGLSEADARVAFGASLERTVRRLRVRRLRSLYYESPNQTFLEVDAARLLGLALVNVHNPLDEVGRRIGQAQLDAALAVNPRATLGDLLAALYALPETRIAAEHYDMPAEIAIGDPDAPAERAAFVHGALSAPEHDIVRFYWRHGIRTVVTLHAAFEDLERLRQAPEGYLILTGHYAGDSYGFTPYVRALRERGLEVTCVGGAIDVAQFPTEMRASAP